MWLSRFQNLPLDFLIVVVWIKRCAPRVRLRARFITMRLNQLVPLVLFNFLWPSFFLIATHVFHRLFRVGTISVSFSIFILMIFYIKVTWLNFRNIQAIESLLFFTRVPLIIIPWLVSISMPGLVSWLKVIDFSAILKFLIGSLSINSIVVCDCIKILGICFLTKLSKNILVSFHNEFLSLLN